MIIVQACEALFTGDGRYRMHQPSEALGRLPGVTAIDCPITHPSFGPLSRIADVLILQFFNVPDLLPLIERRRADGKATVFETADYYLDIQPWNPIAPYWRDPDLRRMNREFISRVDAVQVSTARLAEHWRDLAQRIVVFENHLKTVPPLAPPRIGSLTVGWAGSQGHLADWRAATRTLQPWFERNPDTNAAVMGHGLMHEFLALPAARYRTSEAGVLEDYFAFLPQLDIGLAPLLPTEFNRCRSDVKFLEYAAYGVAGIYQNMEPYRTSVQHGITGFLFNTHDEMLHLLDTLRDDHQLRTRMREAAHRYVSTERVLEKRIGERLEFYRSLVSGAESGTALDSELLSGARREDDYFQLSLQGEAQTAVELISAKPTPEGVQRIFEIAGRHPDFLFLLEHLGRQLNDLKMPGEALGVLSRAAQLAPHSSVVQSELGRSRLLSGDREGCWNFLMNAVNLNPIAISSWIYLLRAARDRPAGEIQQLIAELDQVHPQSVVLAAHSVELLSETERVPRLISLLDRWTRLLSGEEIEFAAQIIPRMLARLFAPGRFEPLHCVLLEKAVMLFPDSELLRDLFAAALEAEKRFGEADDQRAQALRLSKITAQRAADGAGEGDDAARYRRLIGEYISRVEG